MNFDAITPEKKISSPTPEKTISSRPGFSPLRLHPSISSLFLDRFEDGRITNDSPTSPHMKRVSPNSRLSALLTSLESELLNIHSPDSRLVILSILNEIYPTESTDLPELDSISDQLKEKHTDTVTLSDTITAIISKIRSNNFSAPITPTSEGKITKAFFKTTPKK